MNRIFYKPNNTAKYFLNLEELLILNYLNDNKRASYNELMKFVEDTSGCDGDEAYKNLYELGLIHGDDNKTLFTPKGVLYFSEDTKLSPEEYELADTVLNVWNSIPQTTKHKLKPISEPQTKTVYKTAHIVASACRGKISEYINGCKYHDTVVSLTEPLLLSDIIDTIKDYSLKFNEDYYPNNKKILPTTILEFFMSHKTSVSEFFAVFWDGVIKKKKGTSSQLEEWGITVNTIKKVYDVMLSPEDRNSESAKYLAQKQLILLKKQHEGLTNELDLYYTWNKNYRELCKNFNYFVYDYVDWIGNNINGDIHLMYLQVKEGHEIYSQFKAWYYDKYQIRFKVGVSQRDYLLNKNKKYMGNKKEN